MSTSCVTGACRGEKKALDPMELDVGMAVSHHVGVGKQTRPSGRATSALGQLAISSAFP